MSALDVQVGGDHYKKYKIQPMEYSMANGLDACQHTAIKYITRFRDKGGIADLEKAKHCIDLLIEFEQKGAQIETTDLSSAERTFVPAVPKLSPEESAPSAATHWSPAESWWIARDTDGGYSKWGGVGWYPIASHRVTIDWVSQLHPIG